ncbi:MAG TPA: D-alanine--D-alanine ligase [Kiritimatiellae bacterium]|nr:D-alanine--D-alanine ligase [Kiritimatiellia bacterium]
MKRRFQRVAVLMGGPSSEREVSRASGRAVAGGLRRAGYEVVEVDLEGRELVLPDQIEAVFIALHGEFGEDGTVQEVLEERAIPYTGSGPTASRAAFDKVISKRIFVSAGLPVAPYEVIRRPEERTLPLPVVIKPPRQGSSIGVHRVMRERDWQGAFEDTLRYDGEVIVEKFIQGRELTVGVVCDTVLDPIEIRAPRGEYSYHAKYTAGATEYLVPAPLEAEQAALLKAYGWRGFVALGCRGLGRMDMRMDDRGDVYVLEMNNIPGFTETSLLPKAARAAGIDFPELCARIMESAGLEKRSAARGAVGG